MTGSYQVSELTGIKPDIQWMDVYKFNHMLFNNNLLYIMGSGLVIRWI